MPTQDLNRTKIAGCVVDDRRFGASKRVGAIFLSAQTYRRNPLINQAGVLPRTQVAIRVYAIGERDVSFTVPSAPLKPCEQTGSDVCCDFELDRSSGFLLDHHRTRSDIRTGHERANLRLHQVAPSQLASNGEVEQGSVPQSAFAIKEEADRPNLPR